jgi:ribonuclease-3
MPFLFNQSNRSKEISIFLKNILGYRPRNIMFYHIALMHKSKSEQVINGSSINNERLEYLGDAVLSLAVADYLFKKFPLLSEGPLSILRAKIVCRENLNKLAHRMGIDTMMDAPATLKAKFIYGDALEALLGALYLDKGYEKTKKIIINKIFKYYVDMDLILEKEKNFKSKILAWSQKHRAVADFKHTEERHIGSKRKLFKAQLFINNSLVGEGLGYTIKQAEQQAAEKGWKSLN